jgi:hypothetical protein
LKQNRKNSRAVFKGEVLRNGSFLWIKIDISHLQLLIVVQDEDSCGKRETSETPQERSDEEAHRPPAESEVLHGNQKRFRRELTVLILVSAPLVVFTSSKTV